MVDSLYNLILYTFQRSFLETEFDGSMCILAPTNKLCDEVNDLIMSELPGVGSEYVGINANMTKHVQPIEFLNKINIESLPNTHLR